ncbi:MAG: SDR family oxidoreductase [Rhodospirillaceae bacterium]
MATHAMRDIKPGLRVLVTAGAAGIGRSIAETFADRGAKVFVCDVDETALATLAKDRPDIGQAVADVSDQAQVEALFDAAEAALGGLDVLVNNAGIAGPTALIHEIDPDAWRQTIDINLNGHFYCLRRAVPLLKQSDDASIINLSSVAGRLGFALRTPYSATKWAIVGLTESLAKELGPVGIRVNCIQPGVVEGPRIDRVVAARAEAEGRERDDVRAEMLGKVSLRRTVSGQDIAEMAAFLCTPMGANITGQALSVCAGVETI